MGPVYKESGTSGTKVAEADVPLSYVRWDIIARKGMKSGEAARSKGATMELDATKIGVFGINLRSDFDQTWLTFWRNDEGFKLDWFAMIGDEDPIQEEPQISTEDGERAIAQAIECAGIAEWEAVYDASAAEAIENLVWTLDIDDLAQEDVMFVSGNAGVPSCAQFEALIAAMRLVVPTFAEGMEGL